MLGKLTTKQQAVYDFMQQYLVDNHNMPTRPDIARHFRVTTNAAHEHVCALFRKGYLKDISNHSHAIYKFTQISIGRIDHDSTQEQAAA